MKKIRLVVFLAGLLMNGCVYANVKVPLDEDLAETRLGSKKGASSSHSVLWLVAWGDAGIAAAAADGGLSVINHADQQYVSVLFGTYARRTTIVYGD